MSEYKQDRIEPENPIIDRQIRKTRFRGHMDANEFLKLASQEESETYPESLIGSSFGSGIHQGMVFRHLLKQ